MPQTNNPNYDFRKEHRDNVVLVTVSDNHFAVMLAALLKSIDRSYEGGYDITIYIVDDGVFAKNRRKINALALDARINLVWVPIKEAIPKHVMLPLDGSTFPLNVYARVCIPYFLPKTTEKAIYLDADMLVMKDVLELWQIDLKGYSVAAVTDSLETVNAWAAIRNYAELGIPANAKYFNTGLLILDLKKWREEETPLKIFERVEENIPYAAFPEQYGMNVHFANNWLELDPLWNTYAQLDEPSPYIIHFTGMKPIYKGYNFNATYKQIFFDHLKLTPYSGYKPKEKYFRLINKGLHVAEKKWLSFVEKGFAVFRK